MGRRKIVIKQIPDVKLRHITFNKRKNGLFKKAAELSMLCNLNLLLVCEDGLGNLIQYSKNKITDISSFLSQCNYQTVIDLTAEDYPDFSKINKKKDKDNQDTESGVEDDYSPPQEEERNTRSFQQMAAQHKEAPKQQMIRNLPGEANHISDDFSTRAQKLKRGLNMVQSVSEQPPSSSIVNESEITQKKNKNRLNLRLKIPKPENANESSNQQQQVQQAAINNNDTGMRMPSTNDSMGMPMRKQNDFSQMRATMEKPLDFTSPPFMPYMDLKRLSNMGNMSNMYEPPMTSPFKFYSQNGRVEPSLSSVFKGMSPFAFNIAGTPLVPKMNLNEAEEKFLDTASAIRYINRAGMGTELAGSAHSNPGHKVFTFNAEEAVSNQVPSRNELLMAAAATQRPMQNQIQMQSSIQSQIQIQNQMQDYVNLPSVPKSEPETDMNIPLDTFSARRFNFDGYFKDFDESMYDPRKKYKMN